ncbi:Crp/Fnr family transcriptional regulator [Neolewinella lacunae]|uniref:Crp/Fnr family transcriptional regulator n=1 Tax=Neolewinella lacunae TaxID=1517758 RepID=UPI0029F5863E|nr:Crp/Fnr family transcriptional regulator [Neolewinella lacunae]
MKKGQLILREGDVCQHNSFVVHGCFRMYKTDENGKDHNLQFATENWWILDMDSFYSQQPSVLNIEALEESTVYQIKRENQIKLYTSYPRFNRIFRVLSENALIASQRRVLQNLGSSTEERYLDFIERYPLLFGRISNLHVASYLGITPEFLSVVRKRLASNKG